MIVDRYCLLLSKMWLNLTLTVTMETEHSQRSHADQSRSRPKRHVGSGNEIALTPRKYVWKTQRDVLHTTTNNEINVFPWSIFYGKQTLVQKAGKIFMEEQQWKELEKQQFFPARRMRVRQQM